MTSKQVDEIRSRHESAMDLVNDLHKCLPYSEYLTIIDSLQDFPDLLGALETTNDITLMTRGKWVPNNTSIHRGAANCSECGKQAREWYNYCPNCGANMKG